MALTKPKLSQNIDTDISVFADPILVLHQGSALADVDTGFLFNRANGLVSNVAIYWSESANSFVTAFTTSTGVLDANISVTSYANIISGTVTANRISTVDGVYWSGNGAAFSSAPGGSTGDIQYNNNQTFDGANIRYDSTNGNLIISSVTESTSNLTGAIIIKGGAGIAGNVYTNKLYTAEGLFWAGNGNAVVTGSTSFTNVAVSGGNTITANTTGTSTLTFVAGTGIALSADATTDSITISQAASATIWSTDSDFGSINDSVTLETDNGLITDSVTESYDLGSFYFVGLVLGSSLVVNTVPGNVLITGTELTVGNVLPSANVTYSLGSEQYQWRDLWVSNNTIYIGNTPITVNNGTLNVPGPIYVNGKQAVNGPAFSAYPSGAQSITNGSLQKVLFQTEEYDTNDNFVSSTFTPTVEGYYQFNATVGLDGATGTGECMIVLYKNGSEYKRGWNSDGTQFAANNWSMSISTQAHANGTGDYFEIYIQQGSGGNLNTQPTQSISWFQGCMMRGA